MTSDTSICDRNIGFDQCSGKMTFDAGISTKTLTIGFKNPKNLWQKSFGIKISLTENSNHGAASNLVLGELAFTSIKIIKGTGTIQFERTNYYPLELCGSVNIPVLRLFQHDGEISVNWKTIGYKKNQTGHLNFAHGVTKQDITIDIKHGKNEKILDEETFLVELFDAENGTKLGQVTRTTVTIDNKRDNDGNFRNMLGNTSAKVLSQNPLM